MTTTLKKKKTVKEEHFSISVCGSNKKVIGGDDDKQYCRVGSSLDLSVNISLPPSGSLQTSQSQQQQQENNMQNSTMNITAVITEAVDNSFVETTKCTCKVSKTTTAQWNVCISPSKPGMFRIDVCCGNKPVHPLPITLVSRLGLYLTSQTIILTFPVLIDK